MPWVKLQKGDAVARKWILDGGWKLEEYLSISDLTESDIGGYWYEVERVENLPRELESKRRQPTTVEPISIIVGGRFYPESAIGYLKGNTAYIDEESYDNLF